MSSEKNEYEITFKNNKDSTRFISVIVKVGTPSIGFELGPGEKDKRDYTPENGSLEFEINPLDSDKPKLLMLTYNFSTKFDFNFDKTGSDKKWKLKFKNLTRPFPFGDDPPTNVEVGVNDIISPKQKK
jgi:hypothetical protein